MLDIDRPGASVLPIIGTLEKENVPFIMVAGYARRKADDPPSHDTCRLATPFSLKEVADAMC